MSDVVFNPDQGRYDYGSGRGPASTSGWITRTMMKISGIQDEAQATKALIVLVVICFIATALVWVFYL